MSVEEAHERIKYYQDKSWSPEDVLSSQSYKDLLNDIVRVEEAVDKCDFDVAILSAMYAGSKISECEAMLEAIKDIRNINTLGGKYNPVIEEYNKVRGILERTRTKLVESATKSSCECRSTKN